MNIAGENINTTVEQFDQLIDMKFEYITNPNTSLTQECILAFARDNIGLADCYSWDNLNYYISAYNSDV